MSTHTVVPIQALLKRFALIYLPTVIVLSIVLQSSFLLEEQRQAELRKNRENNEIKISRALMKDDFEEVNSDLRIFNGLSLLRSYVDSGSPAQRDELAKLFLTLSKEKRHYDKVRYLDASGQEVIRINYNDGKPAIVPHDQLQDKSVRYFFRDTFKLNQGEVYVSPLDLNVENNRLEIPYKPTIRFGMPVFDSAGRKKGILLFNYLGGDLLLNFHEVMRGGDHSVMLLNRDGYWLHNANEADEWGFMLGKKDRTFGHDYADEWRTISNGEEGTLLTANGLFIYSTIHPLLSGQHSSSGSDSVRGVSQEEFSPQDYNWKIVSFTPHDVLSGESFYNQPAVRILLILVYLFLAVTAWIIAIATLSRKLAQDDLRFVTATLEAHDGILISTFYKIRPELQLLFIFCFAALFMTAYEFIKEFIFKGSLTPWKSHITTIFVTAIFATGASLFMRKLALKLSEQLNIAAVAFESQEGMLVTDTNNMILRVNNAFTDITGYTAEEVIGKSTRILGSGHHDANFYAAMWKNINDIGTWAGEIRNQRKNGEIYLAFLNITAVKNQSGIVSNYVATFTDITARVQTESKLAEQLEELRRWHDVTSGREERILDLKHEVNELLAQTGQPPRYPSAET